MTVDAIVLAGALNKQPLSTVSDELLEALIPVAGRPMIQWVLDALRESRSVGEIAVIGPSKELRSRICGQDLVFVDSCDTILNNVKRGLSRFQSPQKVLIVTADVPLLTGEAVDDFVSRCQDDSVQVYYSIVRREVVELAFEDISRTYVTIKDGTFTGGNMLLLDSDIFDKYSDVIDRVISLRKKPLELGMLLGFRCIVKYLFRQLSIFDIEQRVYNVLGLKGRAVISDYPGVGVDVDKPKDYSRVQEILVNRCDV
ncbi:MAG: NTP transferase domain-containing protein [Bacillota bacterium]|nr:NTP transferase domain-containing protein [Bacillota bacterium]HOB91692.1 NTP transferase domain-containing protein [Bacillota bacterium]HPZ54560.1 NTP transferase domain-containing protein [Bacillota bacterium]HQD18358.1 NTP transferase domain-containing protein [Bacillota bacterium]